MPSFGPAGGATYFVFMKLPLGLVRRMGTFLVGLLFVSGFVVRARASDVDDDNQFREDVIVCEEAVAHAEGCCELLVQGDACHYYEYFKSDSCGCGSSTKQQGRDEKHVWPVVAAAEGHRIAGLSCAAMNAVGPAGTTECERLRVALDKENATASHVEKRCE